MSQESALQFLIALQQAPALRVQAGQPPTAARLLTLGREHGYDFTLEELEHCLAAHSSGELDESILEHIVGGTSARSYDGLYASFVGLMKLPPLPPKAG